MTMSVSTTSTESPRRLAISSASRPSAAVSTPYPAAFRNSQASSRLRARLRQREQFCGRRRRVEFRNLGCGIELFGGLRKVEGEASATAESGIHVNETAALFDGAVNGGEAEAGALPGSLVVKKGSKMRALVTASMP